MLAWRKRFLHILEEIAAAHPPREPVDLAALADMVNTIIEGGIVMSKAVKDPKLLVDQLMLFRPYVRLLFS